MTNPGHTPKKHRKTASERRAEQLEAKRKYAEAQLAQERQEYFPRLMQLLERATSIHGASLKIVDGQFELHHDSDWFKFSVQHSDASWDALDQLSWQLDMRDAELAEQRRKAEIRAGALSKLSEEERALLGV